MSASFFFVQKRMTSNPNDTKTDIAIDKDNINKNGNENIQSLL